LQEGQIKYQIGNGMKAHLHLQSFLAKMFAILCCSCATPNSLGYNWWCDKNRIISICVMPPKQARLAQSRHEIADVFAQKLCKCKHWL